jgi:hypothetical protein
LFTTPPLSPHNQTQTKVAQAAAACESAWRAGITRQRVEILLPLIGATDLDDWPGGIRQQAKAAAPLVEGLLRALKSVDGLKGPLGAEIWDDGDAVGCWSGENLAAVLFPTAPTLERLQRLAGDRPPKLLILVNPQWEVQAGLTSDFGFGGRKQRALDFIDTFKDAYYLRQVRVAGDEVRVLYAHPGEWRVYVVPRGGLGGAAPVLLAALPERPTYKQIEETLRTKYKDAAANKGLFERLRDEARWVQDSLNQNQPPR